VREVVLYWKRTLRRLDLMPQSVIALVEPGSCFVGTLLELAFAADRIHTVDGVAPADPERPGAEIFLTGMNFGAFPTAGGLTRLESRFLTRDDHLAALALRVGDAIAVAEAVELGLVSKVGPRAPRGASDRTACDVGLDCAASEEYDGPH
jgi:benzoyl-CoA-dihydrodiol lyase